MAETGNYSRGAHPSQRRYPPELHERAVRMVCTDHPEVWSAVGVITRVARQLGIGTESLRYHELRFEPLGAVDLKGVVKPLPLYQAFRGS
jgi:transposase-like protein